MRSRVIGLCAAAGIAVAGCGVAGAEPGTVPTAQPRVALQPFKKALLRVEINATDGDAGLQIDADHEPWSQLQLTAPDGRVLLDVRNRGVLHGYGLTELFSESSEPPFTEFPLWKFKRLFPEGRYVFTGVTVDGLRMRSTYDLTHDFPSGPRVTSPASDDRMAPDDVVVRWRPGPSREGVRVVAYEVVVVDERGSERVLTADLPGGARRFRVPAAFTGQPGPYKVEVLAIERSGNQALVEVPFAVR